MNPRAVMTVHVHLPLTTQPLSTLRLRRNAHARRLWARHALPGLLQMRGALRLLVPAPRLHLAHLAALEGQVICRRVVLLGRAGGRDGLCGFVVVKKWHFREWSGLVVVGWGWVWVMELVWEW